MKQFPTYRIYFIDKFGKKLIENILRVDGLLERTLKVIFFFFFLAFYISLNLLMSQCDINKVNIRSVMHVNFVTIKLL